MTTLSNLSKAEALFEQSSAFRLFEDKPEMKSYDAFSSVFSNPPYQRTVRESVKGVSDTANIFPQFQETAIEISKMNTMIYPGGRWIRGTGRGCKLFGRKLLEDKHLQSINYVHGSEIKSVFSSVQIGDGLSTVFYNKSYESDVFDFNGETIVKDFDKPFPLCEKNLASLAIKVNKAGYDPLTVRGDTHKRIRFNAEIAENQESYLVSEFPIVPKSLNNPMKALINNTGGSGGRVACYWIENSITKFEEYANKWKVVTHSSIQGSETYSSWRFHTVDNETIVGWQRITLGYFDTEQEAENFLKYVECKLVRLLFTAGGGSRDRMGHSLAKFVPDLGDYSDSSVIDWSKPLSAQLYVLFGLSDDEIEFIKKA